MAIFNIIGWETDNNVEILSSTSAYLVQTTTVKLKNTVSGSIIANGKVAFKSDVLEI